jgi:hypothetical protein
MQGLAQVIKIELFDRYQWHPVEAPTVFVCWSRAGALNARTGDVAEGI